MLKQNSDAEMQRQGGGKREFCDDVGRPAQASGQASRTGPSPVEGQPLYLSSWVVDSPLAARLS